MTYWHSFYTFTRNDTLANCTDLKLESCYKNFHKNSRNFSHDWCNTSSSGKVALKITNTLMDNYLVDIHLALETFGEIGIWYLEMKPTDGVMIFTYLVEKCEISHRLVAIISWAIQLHIIVYIRQPNDDILT